MTKTLRGFEIPAPRQASIEHATWRIVRIIDVHDGDTITVLRECEVHLSEWLTSKTYDRKPVKLRLARLDTPELDADDPAERERAILAREDLCAWVSAHRDGGLGTTSLGDGGFSRILAEVFSLGEDGTPRSNASDVMRAAGWPAYVKGR